MFLLSTLKGQIAQIDEVACIGCTKCITACPVDAILGAENLLHHVLQEACIGCKLCIDPCPVDCITMVPYEYAQPKQIRSQQAKQRMRARKQRLKKAEDTRSTRMQQRKCAITQKSRNPVHAVTNQSVQQQHLALQKLEIQIKKAEKAFQNADQAQQAYGKKILTRLYQKKAEWNIKYYVK